MKARCRSSDNLSKVDTNQVSRSASSAAQKSPYSLLWGGKRPLPQIDVYKSNLRRLEKFLAVQIKHTDKNSGFIICSQMHFF